MPYKQPQAQFVPISPNFDLHALVESTENLDYVPRISKEILKHQSLQSFEALIFAVVIQEGKPLVIEDWGSSLPPSLFSRKWLEENLGPKPENVRDISNECNIPMTIGHYLRSMVQLTRQCNTYNFRDPRCQRLYLKDIDCPDAWANHLEKIIPECIYYLNENIESKAHENNKLCNDTENKRVHSQETVAPAGDLMSSLPSEMRALNLMCYIGHEGTYTAAHREMCATIGHNIMIEASKEIGGEKEGSSLWFMTESKEHEIVLEYFSSILGHDVDVEKHFAQVNAWKKAPFKVWVVEQKVGDLILIPPLAPHQVWNRGTRTMKVAWNRTTVDTLELALHKALPYSRMVCRDEQYKCKAIIYYSLKKYYKVIQCYSNDDKKYQHGRSKQLLDDFIRLFCLYQEIILSETFSPGLPEEKDIEMLPFDSGVTCSYCRCNIFNRFLTCKSCNLQVSGEDDDTYDICMECFVMGRSCSCISNLSWVQQWDWIKLENCYEVWRSTIARFYSHDNTNKLPEPLQHARKNYGKKSVAEICQEQLRIRPHKNSIKTANSKPCFSKSKPEIKEEREWHSSCRNRLKSKPAKKKRRKFNPALTKKNRCHVCWRYEWDWKMAFCSTCKQAYCYDILWREFDMMPRTVMEDNEWHCPKCLKICSCRYCRKISSQMPYQPKWIILGHDTKKIADYRSVESLVDFSKPKLFDSDHNFITQESSRIEKLKKQLEAKKAKLNDVRESKDYGKEEIDLLKKKGEIDLTAKSMYYIDPCLLDLTVSKSITNQPSPVTSTDDFDKSSMANEKDPLCLNNSPSCVSNSLIEGLFAGDIENYHTYDPASPCSMSKILDPNTLDIGSQQSYPDPSFISENCMVSNDTNQLENCVDSIMYGSESQSEGSHFEEPAAKTPMEAALSDMVEPLSTVSLKISMKQKQKDFIHNDHTRNYYSVL